MRYTPEQYCLALYELTADKNRAEKAVIANKFVQTLIKNNGLQMLEKIKNFFPEIRRKKEGKKKVVVSSSGQIEKNKIKELFGEKAEIEFVENPSLKGGIKIEIDDLRIDNSVSKRLENIKKALT